MALSYLSTSFVKNIILIQPTGEPREHQQGEVPATQNFIKDKMTGMAHFEKSSKKLKMKSQDRKNV